MKHMALTSATTWAPVYGCLGVVAFFVPSFVGSLWYGASPLAGSAPAVHAALILSFSG